MIVVKLLPSTRLWELPSGGMIIVLQCACGLAVDYPGHPDSRTHVTCDGCGTVWTVDANDLGNVDRFSS